MAWAALYRATFSTTFCHAGKERILDKRTEFVALHKERHVFAINLTVSKISGIGEDTMLMGIIQPAPIEADVAKLWLLENGQTLSVVSRVLQSRLRSSASPNFMVNPEP